MDKIFQYIFQTLMKVL